MSADNDVKPVVVFSGNTWEAGLVQNLLENEGIPAFLQNENIGTIAPWQTSSGGVAPVKVIVSSADLAEARQVVKTFQEK